MHLIHVEVNIVWTNVSENAEYKSELRNTQNFNLYSKQIYVNLT